MSALLTAPAGASFPVVDPTFSEVPPPPPGFRPSTPVASELPFATRRVLVGSVGRIWLWFLVGCLLIATVPVLIGWKSYLIESGSMQPRISPGDVVLASKPPATAQELGGRVVVFDSPSVPGRIVTHRVVEVSSTGQMRTRGDANQTADSAPITLADVRGMGRLLVKWIGLPVLWTQQGRFGLVALFLLTVVVAALAVRWDRETEDDDDAPDLDLRSAAPPPPPGFLALPPAPGPGALSRLRATRMSSATVFVALASTYALALTVPSVMAAIAAQTSSPSSSWSVPNFSYATEVAALSPYVAYPLNEASGNNVADISGNGRTGTYVGGITYGVTGPLTTDTPNTAVTLTNASSCIVMPNNSRITPAPTVYSSVAWIRVPNGYSQGGKILGFESNRTGVSDSTNGGQYDRHVYMDGAGRIRFGVWLGSSFTLATTASYNDGQWHMVATTMGPTGMRLYVDGVLQGSSTNTASEVFSNGGWWRFGCGNLSGWNTSGGAADAWTGPNAPTTQRNYPLLGSLDGVAVWQNRVLTDAEIAFLYFTR